MKNLKATLLLIVIVSFSSCTNVKELDIGNIKSYKFNGFKNNTLNFELTIPILNPNNANIVISEVNLKAYYKDRPLGVVETADKIVIIRKSKSDYTIPVNIKITNLLAGMSMLTKGADILEDISFEGYLKARKRLLFKKIEIDKSTSGQFFKF